jgi:cytoskeleton protein RodZ
MSVGTTLRERRIELGMDLGEISEYLRIKLDYLAAIENEDLQELPGGAYAIGFVKTYAKTLGLDDARIADAFRKEQADAMRKAPLKVRTPLSESRVPTTGLIAIAAFVGTMAWIAWAYLGHGSHAQVEVVPAVPDRLAVHNTPEAPATDPAAATATPLNNSLSSAPPAGPDTIPPLTQAVGPVTTSAQPADQEPDEARNDTDAQAATPNVHTAPQPAATSGAVYGAPAGTPSRVSIHALSDSWVQIHDPSHAAIYTGILRTGDLYRLPDVPGYTFTTGNASGITLQLDGKDGQPLGAPGQVLRNVPVAASRAQ